MYSLTPLTYHSFRRAERKATARTLTNSFYTSKLKNSIDSQNENSTANKVKHKD